LFLGSFRMGMQDVDEEFVATERRNALVDGVTLGERADCGVVVVIVDVVAGVGIVDVEAGGIISTIWAMVTWVVRSTERTEVCRGDMAGAAG